MKKRTPLLLAIISCMVYSCNPPVTKDDPNAITPNDSNVNYASAYWKYASGDEYTTTSGTFNGTQIESDCNDNNKMWITLGSLPTADRLMRIVNYNKGNLDSNELRIDIAHNNDDYLTAGNDSAMARIYIKDGRISVNFDTVVFAHYTGSGPSGDSTRISGYIDQLR